MTDKSKGKLGGLFAAIKESAKPYAPVAARSFVVACIECGAPRVDGSDSRECRFCGGNMISRPACSACGQGMNPDDTTCPHCKVPVGGAK